jgi:hypothetical protein
MSTALKLATIASFQVLTYYSFRLIRRYTDSANETLSLIRLRIKRGHLHSKPIVISGTMDLALRLFR